MKQNKPLLKTLKGKAYLIFCVSLIIFMILSAARTTAAVETDYPIKETSIGPVVEVPLVDFREIIITANTTKQQLNVLYDDYNTYIDNSVPLADFEASIAYTQKVEGKLKWTTTQRNIAVVSALIAIGVAVTMGLLP